MATHSDFGYGYYPGGDPRNFHPDPECCTEEEVAKHKAACQAWDRGETPDPGGPHVAITGEGLKYTDRAGVEHIATSGHLTVAHYGLGTYTMSWDCEGDPECPECNDFLEPAAP